MPITSSAKKALSRDRHRTKVNRIIRTKLKTIIDKTKQTKDSRLLPQAYQIIDRAAKNSVIHKNKAARLKSQLARLTKPTPPPSKSATKKSTPKKSATKKTTTKKSTPKKK